MRTAHHINKGPRPERGIVLPIALIMLVIISFAGLLAARNSSTYEQFSNNMRTNQVARQASEDALRYCERVAIDMVDNEGADYAADVAKIVDTVIASDSDADIKGANWNTASNWQLGADLIEVTLDYGADVNADAKTLYDSKKPGCIIQMMSEDRFLITSRGLSNDAVVEDGLLTSGSEVWLQSILSPKSPIKSDQPGQVF